jgi:hypothetical protein
LVALSRDPEWNQAPGRRHNTPAPLVRLLWARLVRWFPARHGSVAGDTGYGTSETARFCGQQHTHLTLVSKVDGAAACYAPAPPRTRRTMGRPRVKGQKLASPQEGVAHTAERPRRRVAGSGGPTRALAVVTGTGPWYRSGAALVDVRWGYGPEGTGTHRAEDCFPTAITLKPPPIVAC